MFEPLLIPVVLVAVVLLASGAAKLGAPDDVASAFDDLRVPGPLRVRPVRLALPWAEIVLGVSLVALPAPASTASAVAATLLMAGYTVLIGRALGFDEDVSCACFGRWGASQVTGRSMARNVLLLVASIGALCWTLTDARPAALAVVTGPGWAWLLGAALVGAVTWLVGSPNSESPDPTEVTASVEELDYLRSPIPMAYLERPDGERITLRELAATKARLLLFVKPNCGACRGLEDQLPALRERLGVAVGVELVSRVAGADFLDNDGEAAHLMEIRRVPAAVLLGADGLLAGGPVVGRADVDAFVDDIAAQLG